MSTALALTSCEAQNIAVAGGQETKAEGGREAAKGTEDGFRKKLEDCEAMVNPMQPPTTDSSMANAEDGIQNETGMIQGFPGMSFVLEGLETPEYPMSVAQTQTEAAGTASAIPMDGMVQESLPDGEQADSTLEPNAWTQTSAAGATPAITQDEILKTVGAYLDAASEAGTETGAQTQEVVAAQAAASPTEEQTQAVEQSTPQNAVNDAAADPQSGVPSDVRAEADTAQKAVVPDAAKEGNHAATDKTGDAVDKADSTMDTNGKYNAVAQTDITAPAAKDVAETPAADTKTAETAQYTRENVLRIVDKVSTQAQEGRYDFDVELKPEFLGKVSIKLTMEDGMIRMQIKTDDMAVKGMLTDQTSSLLSELKEKGITLTSVDVTYESQASLDGGRQPFEQNEGGARQGGKYYAQAETTGSEPAAEPYGYYVGLSSVEFLA